MCAASGGVQSTNPMRHTFRKIVIAADRSGAGKTTVSCGLLAVLKKRGVKVQSFKCGPDYIDPMFHRRVLGVPSGNLDSFFTDAATLRRIFTKRVAESGAELALVEGVMGYYDGLGGVSSRASTWEIAHILDAPTILVMDAKGASVSIAALVRGMMEFREEMSAENNRSTPGRPACTGDSGSASSSDGCRRNEPAKKAGSRQSGIRGLILNRVSPMFYPRLKSVIEAYCPGIEVLGYLPELPELEVPSRHLGLVEPGEIEDFQRWTERVAAQMEESVEVERLLEIAGVESPLKEDKPQSDRPQPVRIAVSEDEAFNFTYEENRALLRQLGAELVPFSPLYDAALPAEVDGLILSGGYPELFKDALHANASMRASVAEAVKQGLPTIAECGGYMYLLEAIEQVAMCGVLPGDAERKPRLVRFGYVEAETRRDSVLGPAGTVLRGHEFHRYDCDFNGADCTLTKPAAGHGHAATSARSYEGIYLTDSLAAGFPHFYYWSNPASLAHFLDSCRTWRTKQQKNKYASHTAHEEYEKFAGTNSQGCDAAGTSTHECAGDREYYRSLAQQHWDSLGKPIDSLGVLEQHVTKLCMIERTAQPHITRRALAVLCADHGCVREGVTQTDSSVTRIVAENFARGLTTTSVLAQQFAVDLFPIDVGMLSAGDSRSSGVPADDEVRATSSSQISASSGPMPTSAALRTDSVNDRCLQHGSGDIAIEPAMSEEVGERALALGRRLVRELKAQGYDILLTGEMGIGNTTPTSALFSAYLGLPVEETVGRGAGLSDEGLERKRDCVRRALRRVNHKNAKQLLFELGGLEIATMAGMFLGAVEEQMPIVIDGAISTAAALAASRILAESNASDTTNSATVATVSASKPEQMSNPEVKRIAESAADALPDFEIHASVADVTLASHVSKDGAARKALEALGLRAIIDADMSLGEGSGAVLLLPLLDAALVVYRGMGSFDDIHVEAYHRFK